MKKPPKKRVLIVEDDKYICRAYQDSLERAGFETFLALDGQEALRQMQADKPDLVLLDLLMPRKSGFDVLEEMKEDDNLKDIPVLIVTNLGAKSDQKKGRALGARDYLIKANYSIENMVKEVNKIFTGK